jgi:hypothetical protein
MQLLALALTAILVLRRCDAMFLNMHDAIGHRITISHAVRQVTALLSSVPNCRYP